MSEDREGPPAQSGKTPCVYSVGVLVAIYWKLHIQK